MNSIFDAIENHDPRLLEEMLRLGADPDQVKADSLRLRPLHAAVVAVEEGGSLELIRVLLKYGANIDSTFPDMGSCSPLLVAILSHQFEAARLLLDAGADPNLRSDEGESALRVCVQDRNHEMAALLLSKGANRTIDASDAFEGATALGMAVYRLDIAMVKLLLEAGADPHVLDLDFETARERLPPRTVDNEQDWLTVSKMLPPEPGDSDRSKA